MPGKVPDKWLDYRPLGDQIEGTRFITFKVPLEENICHKLPSKEDWFQPCDLLAQLSERDLELGLVIDLTFTTRYYKRKVFEDEGIEYMKVFTAGQVVPNIQTQNSFIHAVDDFLSRNADNDKLIGVHCTHGLNRTGYQVCRYMINKLKFDPRDAIQAYNVARGHDIERQNYLKDLLTGINEANGEIPDPLPEDQAEENGNQEAGVAGFKEEYRGHNAAHHRRIRQTGFHNESSGHRRDNTRGRDREKRFQRDQQWQQDSYHKNHRQSRSEHDDRQGHYNNHGYQRRNQYQYSASNGSRHWQGDYYHRGNRDYVRDSGWGGGMSHGYYGQPPSNRAGWSLDASGAQEKTFGRRDYDQHSNTSRSNNSYNRGHPRSMHRNGYHDSQYYDNRC